MRIPLSHYFYSVFILSFIRLSRFFFPLPTSFSHIQRSAALAISLLLLHLLWPSRSCQSQPIPPPSRPFILAVSGPRLDWQPRRHGDTAGAEKESEAESREQGPGSHGDGNWDGAKKNHAGNRL